jgi:hypothetical protein
LLHGALGDDYVIQCLPSQLGRDPFLPAYFGRRGNAGLGGDFRADFPLHERPHRSMLAGPTGFLGGQFVFGGQFVIVGHG